MKSTTRQSAKLANNHLDQIQKFRIITLVTKTKMAKLPKKPKKDTPGAAPEGANLPEKEYKLPISSVLMSQITEFSPRGFFLVTFDKTGEPQVLDYVEDGIMARAIENVLAEIVEEHGIRREIYLESKVFGEDDK